MVSSLSRLENFPVYMESCIENISSILDELQERTFTKKPFYSAEIVRYALLLRYTSIQSDRMLLEHFPLPSLSLLHKICSSTTDTVKCAHTLRNEGKITNDVCLMFGNLKSILLVIWWFIIVQVSYAKDWCRWVMQRIDLVYGSWLEKFYSIPYVIKPSRKTKINAGWFKE